ncbi:MAG: DUF4091 domain-containing protein [Armatimonadetes bacterium]|nr:DUF4091 domain-containing protein [Armatimonadota bacterium]
MRRLLLLLLAASACHARLDDAMRNGGFEEGTGDAPADWGLWPPTGRDAGVTHLRDPAVHRSGAWSGRLRVEPADYDGICTFHHPHIRVSPGMELLVRGWLRTAGVQGSCGVDVQYRDAKDVIVGGAGATGPAGDSDWALVEKRFVVPEGVVAVMPVWFVKGQGTVWLDDLSCDVPPQVEVLPAAQPPKLDGRLDDPVWQAAPNLTEFVTTTGRPDPGGTLGWVAGDRDALYFAVRCPAADPAHLKLAARQRDDTVWSDDSVELFLNPRGDRGEYYQLIANAAGVQYDSVGTARDWNGKWEAAAGREPGAWTLELRVPFDTLPIDLRVGREWSFNVGRNEPGNGLSASWSATWGGFHSPGRFATLSAVPGDFSRRYAALAGGEIARIEAAVALMRKGLNLQGAAQQADAELAGELGKLRLRLADPAKLTAADWTALRDALPLLDGKLAEYRRATLLLALHSQALAQGVNEPQFGVALENSVTKVFKDGETGAGVQPEAVLDLARDESEAVQLVVTPLAGALHGVTAKVDGLPAGAKVRVELYEVAYVPTGQPGYPRLRAGDWPDPLPLLTQLDVPEGQRRAIWVRITAAPDAAPGEVRAAVAVSCAGQTVRVPLRIRVRAVRLPRPGALRTAFGLDPGSLAAMLRGDSDAEKALPVEVYARWVDFLMQRRIVPTGLGTAYVRRVRKPDGGFAYDFGDSDKLVSRFIRHVPERGVVMAGTGSFGWSTIRAAMRRVEESYRGAGWRLEFPAVDDWSSAVVPCDGARPAAHGCDRVSLWVRPVDPAQAGETVTVFFNHYPDRWVTTFKLPAAEWREVVIPIAQFQHNTRGGSLTPAELPQVANFQFVVANRKTPLAFEVDEIRAVGPQGDVVIDDGDLAKVIAPMLADVKARVAHWRAKGWLKKGVLYGWDEVQPADYELCLAGYQAVHALVPDVPIMQTYYNFLPNLLDPAVGVWCPITSNVDAAFIAGRQAAGEDFWTYVCCGPGQPYANYFIDLPAAAQRVLGWQVFGAGATGLLYWETDYWHGAFPGAPDKPRYPDVPWDQEKMATYREFKVNGDGWLLYPGRGDEPVGSVRLEVIADSLEDYELLTVLRALYRQQHDELPPADRLAIERLLAVPPEVSRSWREWEREPAALLASRQAALAWAERLAKSGK